MRDAMTFLLGFRRNPTAYLMLLPTLAVMGAVLVYPLGYLFRLSLLDATMANLDDPRFVGLANFRALLWDPLFLGSLWRTAMFTASAVSAEIVAGLLLALLVHNMEIPGKRLVVALFLIPNIMAPVAVALIWKFMLDYSVGIVNYALRQLGLPPQSWLGDPTLAFVSIVLVSVWQWTPFTFLTFLAGREVLPLDPYEAARVDGATPLQMFRYITLPLLLPLTLVVAFFRIASSVKVFDKVYVLTGGGPGTATELVSNYVYRESLVNFKLGYGGAAGVIVLLSMLILGLCMLRTLFRERT